GPTTSPQALDFADEPLAARPSPDLVLTHGSAAHRGLAVLEQGLEANEILLHRLAGIRAEEPRDGMTRGAQWRRVAHLDVNARAPVVGIESHASGVADGRAFHRLPGEE